MSNLSERFVLDATILNHMARIDRLDVLSELLASDECFTTLVVLDELRAGEKFCPELGQVPQQTWLKTSLSSAMVADDDYISAMRKWESRIGASMRNRGECSVFALAELLPAVAITDDSQATRVARASGLEDVHGTVWLLSRACRLGKTTVRQVEIMVDALEGAGMRLPCTGASYEAYAQKHGLLFVA
ncbi:hypothetical protein [Actinosynnema pretiosum]|uniref:DUF3368 domain-containing protein n=1 Tax=Actinosynnema pretiosum TaxID=42197 RepID=A0A290Z0P5_9PSEU|nr:hypothetical protein [Actinosynnema pretiosum]ATE52601.1 hypothetical protein CNX65_04295 [Actinosynnema pretiosum]